jgi:copper(I)-binding protein
VSWTGRLPDDNYDEFVLSTFLASTLVPGTTIYFPVVQDCDTGTERWTAVPGATRAPAGTERAPGLELLAAASGGMDHSMAGMSMAAAQDTAAAPAGAAVTAGDLAITRPWSRATPGGATTAAGYLTITNRGATPDRLVSVSTPAAAKAELHQMTTKDGVMVMRPLSGGLTLAPGQAVTLAPEGIHLMMTGLKAPLNKGDTLPVTLVFEKAGRVEVALPVQGVGAPGPDGGAADPHAGHKM